MELVHLMLQTLIEMCVANIENQKVIYNSRVIMDVLNGILQIYLHDDNEHNVDYYINVSNILKFRSICNWTYAV